MEAEKFRDTAITLQLPPNRMNEGSIVVEVLPTPGPSPVGPMQRWPSQDVSKIQGDKEEPPHRGRQRGILLNPGGQARKTGVNTHVFLGGKTYLCTKCGLCCE